MAEGINWPKGFAPDAAPIHVVNRFETETAPVIVWRRLIHAAGWPAIYANASDVAIEGGGADLFAERALHLEDLRRRAEERGEGVRA